jgi:hypothetical protein
VQDPFVSGGTNEPDLPAGDKNGSRKTSGCRLSHFKRSGHNNTTYPSGRSLLVFLPNRDIGSFIDMVVHILHALVTAVPVLDLGTIAFVPALSVQHMHPAKDHHHAHHDDHDSDYDFASLIAHITSLIGFRWMSSAGL